MQLDFFVLHMNEQIVFFVYDTMNQEVFRLPVCVREAGRLFSTIGPHALVAFSCVAVFFVSSGGKSL